MSNLTPYLNPSPPVRTARTSRGEAVYPPIGPGLNAANMQALGWLDESRLWNQPGERFSEEIVLRPLHRLDLEGWLAAQLDDLLVEFRVPDEWDAGIPRSRGARALLRSRQLLAGQRRQRSPRMGRRQQPATGGLPPRHSRRT